MTRRARLRWLVALALGPACGTQAPAQLGSHSPAVLTESQAQLVIEQRVLATGYVVERAREATLDGVGSVRIDFVFGQPARGIEWVTAADRVEANGWPPPSEGGPAHVVTGVLDDGAPLQVLSLDERDYVYESNPRWVQRGAPGIDGVEDEVAESVRAFLDYVASEDPPLEAL